jgi:RNA polymerase sigma-70 factor (ECF subfamily)
MDGIAQLQEHRAALTGHCYRMLGSAFDADDAVQETMVRAWKSMDRFDGRASLRTWLYRIATNVCLDALSSRKARARPMEEGPAGTIDDELTQKPRTHWLEPIPDALAVPDDVDPAEQLVLRQSIRLAFVAALQHLPPKQRAALLLTEVLGWSASEVGDALDTTVPSVNSALQRARATLASRKVDDAQPLGETQARLLERYVHAFERHEVDELAALLREDAVFNMPPFDLWLCGPDAVRGWLRGRGAGCRGSRLVPVNACGMPAFAQYRLGPDGHFPWAIIVLDLVDDRIAGWTSFLDVETLFPLFGMPKTPPVA